MQLYWILQPCAQITASFHAVDWAEVKNILLDPGIIITFRRQKKGKDLSADVLLSYNIVPHEAAMLVLAMSDWQVKVFFKRFINKIMAFVKFFDQRNLEFWYMKSKSHASSTVLWVQWHNMTKWWQLLATYSIPCNYLVSWGFYRYHFFKY